jgi:hypothetical protein
VILNPPTPQVTLTEDDHPALGLVCEICGSGLKLLSSCGLVLCIPCWHKAAIRSFEEISPVVDYIARGRHRLHGIRFVNLTIRHQRGESLKSVHARLMESWNQLRRTRFWKDHVDGCILKREVNYGQNGWHPHLQMLTVGRFIPATKSKAKKDEKNLSDVWRKITGDSTIVYIEAPRRTGYRGRELVQELAKYVSKPVADDDDGTPVRIDGWPSKVRFELAEFLAGGLRTKWYCQVHRKRKRLDCLKFEPKPGWKPRPCTGQYRRERTGFRRLLWYGSFKKTRDELNSRHTSNTIGTICHKCEIGHMQTEYWWDEREYGYPIHLNAELALQFIQAHKSTDYDSLREYFSDQNKEGPPAGWVVDYSNAIVTSLNGVRNQEVGFYILDALRSGISAWYVIERGLVGLGQEDFERIAYATRCQLKESGYVEVCQHNRLQLTGKGKWRMHCWTGVEGTDAMDGVHAFSERSIETDILGESSQPDRKIEGVWFKTAAGEIIGPGHFVEYLRKKMEEDGP